MEVNAKLESLQKQISSLQGQVGKQHQDALYQVQKDRVIKELEHRIEELEEKPEAPKDWHAKCSIQSFLLGQISGMVHTMVDLPIDQLREHVDQLHNFLLDKLGKLYYKDDQ